MPRTLSALLVVAVAAGGLVAASPQTPAFFALDDVRPGMVGIGRTVYGGDQLEEFRANIIGVLRNALGPNRDLVLARLEGGPLAATGVMQGMSGSPVYIEGRLLGAVSYALGSFPKEPFAGITPIAQMTEAVDGPRAAGRASFEPWPMTLDGVFERLGRIADEALAPLGSRRPRPSVVGPPALAELVPALRPIGAAMVVSGLDPVVGRAFDRTFRGTVVSRQSAPAGNGSAEHPLRPGDPVGMSLVRGDLELGATGTVTHVDGRRVYAFGHPFLNLGPTSFAMTRAHVYTVLPSLDVSMKIAALGPVIGTMSQDRTTGVGGTLGSGPPELAVSITLASDHDPERRFSYAVLHDPLLTPLFAYVTVFNTLVGHERTSGALSIAARGTIDYGARGRIEIDDFFSGDAAIPDVAAAATASIGPAVTNEFESVMPRAMDLRLEVSEQARRLTIERAWLDTTRPRFGATHTLHVLLRRYRAGTETVAIPIAMPSHAGGPLRLLVADASTLTALEQRELQPAAPTSWPALFKRLSERRQRNRLYVRLLDDSAGTAVGGDTLPALPPSVRAALDSDPTVGSTGVSRTVIGAWERRFDTAIVGTHQLTLTLTPAR
jgi:hypothetical protein